MDALLATRLRRQLPLVAAALVCVLLFAVHVSVFRPLDQRYHRALAHAGELGLLLDPSHPSTQLPLSPRLFTLLADNSLPEGEAEARGQSGTLTADLVQSLSAVAAKHGLETVVAEPGLLTQQSGSVELRAHLRLRGSYAELVAMLDDLARGGRLWSVERFTIRPLGSGVEDIELWMAGCLLKRGGGGA